MSEGHLPVVAHSRPPFPIDRIRTLVDHTRDNQIAHHLLKTLTNLNSSHGSLIGTVHLPAREGRYAAWPSWVPEQLINALNVRGIESPWLHQVQAFEAVSNKNDIVMSTGTGSGKSLAAWLPILTDLANEDSTKNAPARISHIHDRPSMLYLSPTKALAADQFNWLDTLLGGERDISSGNNVPSAKYHEWGICASLVDGDTSSDAKQWARGHADIVLSNPDYLHFALLPQFNTWKRFLASLKYVVIDELHYWKGLTGSHVALVIRRLLRICRHFGADPTIIMLSATLRDPSKTASAFTQRKNITAITQNNAESGEHHILLWQPQLYVDKEGDAASNALLDPTLEDDVSALALEKSIQRVSATSEAAVLSALLIEQGAQLLTFVRSRSAAESVAAHTRDILSSRFSEHASHFESYRGGYLPEERRLLERQIRSGQLRGLATTNALELGVDLSGLDATITVGWPGTRASLWQQVGRAGRRGQDGVSVLIAADDPLDSYIVNHPELLRESIEANVFDTSNPWILSPHLCAAAQELPLQDEDLALFGLTDQSLLQELADQGFLVHRPTGWHWDATRGDRAADLTDLRGGGHDVPIIDTHSGTIIGTIGDNSADSQVFPDAIYLHRGRTFHVLSLSHMHEDTQQRVALVEEVSTRLRTRAKQHRSVSITREGQTWHSHDQLVTWHTGDVEVATRVTDYDLLRLPQLEFIRNRELHLPQRRLPTLGMWLTFTPEGITRTGINAKDLPGALHAAEHVLIAMLPLLATCDRWDLGGLSTACHDDTAAPTVFIHDAIQGGSGYAFFGFHHAKEWVTAACTQLENCQCETGCPSCIQSPKCGNNNEPLSKPGAIALLQFLQTRCP